ncbi:hypothetical protein [uncultured Sphingomonas sp.]|uniref:hypothetical protein n=1 Tax=uncultured Sphingomonas sp. TaxID=158754 RepID=UPI00258BE886|nr:hypothetical protein [uncultured Sphingomonas sp.]
MQRPIPFRPIAARAACVMLALALAACGEAPAQEPVPVMTPVANTRQEAQPEPPRTLVNATQADEVARVCAASEVSGALQNIMHNQGYGPALSRVGLQVDTYTVESLDPARHELRCTARVTPSVTAQAHGLVPERGVRMDYSMRPSLTASDGRYIVTVFGFDALVAELNLAAVRDQIAAEATVYAAPATEPVPVATAEAAQGDVATFDGAPGF